MKVETVKAIFTNLLFVIGVILIIYGFIQGALTAVRLLSFDQYPLESYEETRCEQENYNYLTELKQSTGSESSAVILTEKELAERKQEATDRQSNCEASQAYARRVRQTEHIVTSITTLVSGTMLVWSFKRFIFDSN